MLVAINSVFQIVAFAALGYFYLKLLPGWLGLQSQSLGVSLWDIACSVLVFLGLPLAAGYLTRRLGEARRGRVWYEQRLLPRLGPVALYGPLFTVVVLFALQGATITNRPGDVARIALPLLVYFGLMFGGSFLLGVRLHLGYPKRRRWPSRPPATTSSSRSPSRSASSARPPANPSLGRRAADRSAGARRPRLPRPVGPRLDRERAC